MPMAGCSDQGMLWKSRFSWDVRRKPNTGADSQLVPGHAGYAFDIPSSLMTVVA